METAEETKAAPRFSAPTGHSFFRAPTGAALNWTLLLVLVVIWGSTFAGIRIGVETIDPAWLVTGRLLGASAFLAIWILGSRVLNRRVRADGSAPVSMKAIGWFCFIGVTATAVPFVLYATAAQTTGSAVLAICNGATPFGTAILAHFFVGDRLSGRRVAGVMLGFLGLVVLVLPEFGEEAGGTLTGILLAIGGALLYSVGNVGTRRAPRVEPAMSSFIIVFSAGLSTLALALLTSPFPTEASTASMIAMVMLALLPTALAMFLYVWLIQRAGAVFVSFTTYMSPLWATALGVLFLNEELHWSMVGALALILVGVAVANRPAKKVSPAI
ncbi:MAG: DMT family transporter [Hyphomonadaceae bacterium]|nr:DMT family transporter [Hyphomonadaceae bacterium]